MNESEFSKDVVKSDRQDVKPNILHSVMVNKSTGKVVQKKQIDIQTGKETITFEDPEFKKKVFNIKN